MASPVADVGQSHQQHHLDTAVDSAIQEARTWIEAVTGRCFGEKDFRGGLENGILLCELLSSVKPGLVKKINRLLTPIAGLDNLTAFLRGCEDLGLKGSQLFDPGDLQDTSTAQTNKGSDCSRKLKNVLITLYWLGRAANCCTSYNGPTLDLAQFEGLLSQMRKEAEEADSPGRSIRDSGYIDSWDSERSDSLSPPAHGREDSLDSLDSLGSRSRQTPSPDALGPRANSDGRGSDSESDGPFHRRMPDVRKDDMLARRTSVSEPKAAMPFNQYLPNKSNQSGYVPLPLRKKRSDSSESSRKSWSTATSPVGGERPLSSPARSCSEELFKRSTVSPNRSSKPIDTPQMPIAVKDQIIPSTSMSMPASLASSPSAEPGHGKNKALSESDHPPGAAAWLESSLQTTSVSMIDMRDGEDPLLPPHSQARHELMHNQYNRIKEDESHWQDDLARWKNRRRSISQDLIKKEEERKMMEQLLTGDQVISHRRRSIKTYREIVEDKERREEELRIAYKNARTQEEASAILQRYAQRFSISEAILERLQLPKLLDRSVSADPTCPFPLSISLSPTSPEPPEMDPNGPLRYLRQQSAPSPKFTSTLETRVEEYSKDRSHHTPQIRSRSSEPPSSRALSPKPVPLLTPKPYFHSRSSTDPWSGKVDGLLRVNGDTGSDGVLSTPDSSLGLESPVFQACTPTSPYTPSSSPAPVFSPLTPITPLTPLTPISPETASPVPNNDQEMPNHKSEDVEQKEANEDTKQLTRPNSLPTELQKPEESSDKLLNAAQPTPLSDAKTEHEVVESSSQPKLQSEISRQVTSESSVSISQEWRRESVPTSLSAPGSFGGQPSTDHTTEDTEKDLRGNVSAESSQSRRGDRWSWDQEEERQRQERWQQEQERMLQEKYRLEQEKLKQEWERAQREVAEEERKYHEEEQKILEETTAPLTPLSSVQPSPSRGDMSISSAPQDTIVRSLADWERKQEALERQKGNPEEYKRKENDRTSDISTADDSMKTARSSFSHSMSQADTHAHSLQNGQKSSSVQTKMSSPGSKAQEAPSESSRQSRRSGPLDNNRSSSKPPASPSPHPPSDTAPPVPNRSVSGKKLCSSCGQPLGKGAAMIIETLSLYFHIHCFKCGVCKGQLGDTTTGTDVRIRSGLLNCHQCYIRSRSAGQPTML
ncbi:LIM and calponin homology domains-containing protein 1-like isoform X2 [Periophthalmus magnuspinnatus]|uniref:LIM and calponin homology domains-containing protein 1-like isoform X2 n=1 Tax=Periophthalmus magnuspinnatus TaxID=409849 RepID=UPI00243630F7|nr:LIM and calponin homology domains-containing protein 1-like isoform X2 [Periophthalmus magnuspinnatus]